MKRIPQLKITNIHGLIFLASVTPIFGTVHIESKDKIHSYEILILDENSTEILKIPLNFDKQDFSPESSFTWDLKSNSNSYVNPGYYTVVLVDKSNESNKIKCCLTECNVADTRDILIMTRSLKRHYIIPTTQTYLSVYLDMLEDIQGTILERLKNNKFEEPFFVASLTASFIQGIADDLQSNSSSILDIITKFQSKNHVSEQDIASSKLDLWPLFDFMVNHMSNVEDHIRAKAMAKCGQHSLTQNDKNQIVSALVLAIYKHSKIPVFPKNMIGNIIGRMVEGMIKIGIKFISTKHINKSISICRTLQINNSCEVIIQ